MRTWLPALICCACAVCACTATPPPVPPPTPSAAAPVAPVRRLAMEDDWRSLLPVPLGSSVAEVPFELREVLLFQGDSAPAGAEEPECYAAAQRQFRLRGILADDHVLCFVHDRLARAEAVLRLPGDVAPETFPHWCEEWTSGLEDAVNSAEHCAGREGDTAFEATLAYDTEAAGPRVTVVVTDRRFEDAANQRAPAGSSP